MKKQLLLLASIVISTLGFAQIQPSFGVRGGVLSSGMRGDAANSLNNLLQFTDGNITTGKHTGFFAGAYTAIPITNVISFEPGLYYAQKGYELKGTFNLKGVEFLGANAKAQLNTHYIDLPLLLKGNEGGFQIFAGPQLSYLVQADLRTTAGVLGFNLLNRSIDATGQFNRWDAALTGGIGYQFINGINVMAAYDHGLSKVDAGKNLNSYNRAFRIGVGLSF